MQRDGRSEPWFTENDSQRRAHQHRQRRLPAGAGATTPTPCATAPRASSASSPITTSCTGTRSAPAGTSRSTRHASTRACRRPCPVDRTARRRLHRRAGRKGQRTTPPSVPQPGVARWQLTQPLAPQEGFTVVLTFPKGLIAGADARAAHRCGSSRTTAACWSPCSDCSGCSLYCVRRWHAVGRDPRAASIIARYEPPARPHARRPALHAADGLRHALLLVRPAGTGRRRAGAHPSRRGLPQGQMAARARDGVQIDDASDRRSARCSAACSPTARMLELKNTNARIIAGRADGAHQGAGQALPASAVQASWRQHRHRARRSPSASIALARHRQWRRRHAGHHRVGVLMVIRGRVFAVLVRAPTPEGRKLLDEIEGLKLYLGVAEREELARMPGPDAPPVLDASATSGCCRMRSRSKSRMRGRRSSPLAVGAAAAAATTSAISWYRGGGADDLGSLSQCGRQQPEFADRVVVESARQFVGFGRRRFVGRRRWRWRWRRPLIAASLSPRNQADGAGSALQSRAGPADTTLAHSVTPSFKARINLR